MFSDPTGREASGADEVERSRVRTAGSIHRDGSPRRYAATFFAVTFALALTLSAQPQPQMDIASTQQITTSAKVDSMVFSPDGRRLALCQRSNLLVHDIATGQTKRIPTPIGCGMVLAFAADGRSIFFAVPNPTGPRYAIHHVAEAGGDAERLGFAISFGPISLSPDGKRAAYVRSEKGPKGELQWGMFVTTLDKENPREQRVCLGYFNDPEWSADGERIFAVAGQSSIVSISARTGEIATVAEGISIPRNNPWLVTAEGIVFAAPVQQSDRQPMWIVRIPSGERSLLSYSTTDLRILSMAAVPDGFLLAAVKRSNNGTFWDGMLYSVFKLSPQTVTWYNDAVLIHLRNHKGVQ
jgi:Tol biopolymer transport system component